MGSQFLSSVFPSRMRWLRRRAHVRGKNVRRHLAILMKINTTLLSLVTMSSVTIQSRVCTYHQSMINDRNDDTAAEISTLGNCPRNSTGQISVRDCQLGKLPTLKKSETLCLVFSMRETTECGKKKELDMKEVTSKEGWFFAAVSTVVQVSIGPTSLIQRIRWHINLQTPFNHVRD